MSETTALNIPAQLLTISDALDRGLRVTLTYNDHQFTLWREDHLIVVSVEGEVCNFFGCTEEEIKNELLEWKSGAWR